MSWTSERFEDAIRAIAAWDLPGAPELSVPDGPDDFEPFARQLQATRLIGPFLAAAAFGDIELPAKLEADLVTRQEAALSWCIELEVRLLEVSEWFDAAGGIEVRVIKGPAIASLDALNPSLRTFADIDMLILASDIDRAVAILERHGATRPWVQRRPGWDRRFAKTVTMTFGDGIEFDLHRMLADGVHGHRIPVKRLFDSPEVFDIGGVAFKAMSPVHRMLHSAYHLLLGSTEPPLMNLRDLAIYLGDDRIDPDVVVSEVQRWQGEAVLAKAIDLVAERLAVVPQDWFEWRSSFTPDPHDVALISRHRSEGSSFGRAKLDVLRELPALRDKAGYLAALVWPCPEHLASRGLQRRDSLKPLLSRARSVWRPGGGLS